MNLPLESRVERLNRMISESRIIRNDWSGTDEQGRETASLLAALSPEAGEAKGAWACPAEVMPRWFAHLTPWMDANSSTAEWSQMIRRYAACAARWSVLDEAAWRRVEIAARRAAVEEAMRHTSEERVLAACREVLTWLDDDMPESSHAAVKEAAWAAKAALVELWALAAVAEAEAAGAVAAVAATEAEAWAAASAAWAAAWAAKAASAWAEKAKCAAADRIVDAVLSALETECGVCE